MREIPKMIEAYLKKNGLKMRKQLTSGSYGILFSTDPTYDNRVAQSMVEVNRLTKRGFYVAEEMGIWLFNALTTNAPTKPTNSKGKD